MEIATSVWLGTAVFIACCVLVIANSLNRIANELKESNRLKRAEMEGGKVGVTDEIRKEIAARSKKAFG